MRACTSLALCKREAPFRRSYASEYWRNSMSNSLACTSVTKRMR